MSLKDLSGSSEDDDDKNSVAFSGGGINLMPANPMGRPSKDPLEMLINYNEKFKNATPILFRDFPMTQMLATLIGKEKPNCLLIGQAGVGKTKLVEELARMLINNDPLIPDSLKKHTIYELPISNLVSGSGILGELEEKTKAVIDFVSDNKNKAILYIDEIHQLCDNHHSTDQIAQILKPALARGDFKCIGATTLQESTKLYTQPAFNRRFSKVIVEELTQNQTAEILKNILPSYLKHHNYMFNIATDVLETIPTIADQYVSQGSHRPDNAITLLDRAVSNLIMARKSKIVSLQKTVADTSNPIASANAQTNLTALNSKPIITISTNQIKAQAVKLIKGGATKDAIDFKELSQKLEVIKGQDTAISEIITILKREEKNLFPRKKPLTLLFSGASGVGKTEITKIIANHMTGKEPIILNMTEYIHSSSVNQIIGSNIGYIGSDSNVELPFDCLESNPYQFILLDEFEKGDKAVQRLFMRVFDEGKLKTNRHQELDFSKTIIIATTNAGRNETRKLGFSDDQSPKSSKILIADLKNWFDIELLNRFEYIKSFNTLSADTFIDIINNIYNREISRIRQTSHVKLTDNIDDETLDKWRQEYNQDFGARPVFNLVKEYIEGQI
jgi:ATP-dependent Clp protease ATP-binding subunit ClpA